MDHQNDSDGEQPQQNEAPIEEIPEIPLLIDPQPVIVPLDPYGMPDFALLGGIHQRFGRLFEITAPEAMQLTPAETERAIMIKATVEMDLGLERLSDFDYAHYALTCADLTIGETLDKIYMLQALKEEYDIHDTIEDGVESLEKIMDQHPYMFLACEYLPTDRNILFVQDASRFFPGNISTPNDYQIFTKGCFYKSRAVSPTFWSIRAGACSMIECKDVTHQNISFSFNERLFSEVLACGLSRVGTVQFLNTPLIFNVAHAMWKKLVHRSQHQGFFLGVQIPELEGNSICPLFQTPTPGIARQRLLRTLELFLTARNENKKRFRLPEPGRGEA